MIVEPVAIRADRPVAAWQFRAWELLAPRLPRWVVRLLGGMVLRLPRGSRARRWCVLGASVIAWDVTARNRADLLLPIWDPACEWRWDRTFAGLGFDELYRGHEGVKRSLAAWNEIWTERSFTGRVRNRRARPNADSSLTALTNQFTGDIACLRSGLASGGLATESGTLAGDD